MFRRTGILSALALTCFLFCGMTAPTQCKSSGSIGPSDGEVIGLSVGAVAVIGAAIAIPVVIHHNNHTLKGCVIDGSHGLEVQQLGENPKTFALVGDNPGVKVGDLVKLHGAKKKSPKGTDPTFIVEKLSKDYGTCKLAPTAPAP